MIVTMTESHRPNSKITNSHGGVVGDEDGVDAAEVDETEVRDSELDRRVDENPALNRGLSKLLVGLKSQLYLD